MPEAQAAPAAEAAPVADAPEGAALEKAVASYKARQEATETTAGKDASASGSASAGGETKPAPNTPAAKPARPRPSDIAALSQREWKARQKEEAAAKVSARYKPVDEALSKKDLRAAMEVLVKEHGLSFADVINAITEEKPADKTTAELVAAEVARVRAEDKARQDKEAEEAARKDTESKLATVHGQLEALAESGTPDNPDRWELTAVAGKAAVAWDVIEGHYMATSPRDGEGRFTGAGEKLSFEQALDLVEGKLREKQAARRPKTDAGTSPAGGNQRSEAESTRNDGRVAVPSFGNRATTSIAPVKPATPAVETADEAGLTEAEHIRRAARRANIRL